jgi:integrase
MSREVRKVADQLGMKSIHLHSLRHFAATELLAAGISARDTAEMLGHADPSLTLKVYAHATTERQRAAAGVLARIVESPDRSNVK